MSWAQAVFVIASLMFINSYAGAGVLFEDHFNDQSSLNNYTVKHGNASVVNQRLNMQGSGWPRDSLAILNGDPKWTNFEISVKMQPIAGWHNSRILFRSQNFDWSSGGKFGKGYFLELNREALDLIPGELGQFNLLNFYRLDCPTESACDPELVATTSFGLLDTPVDAKVVVDEGHIQVFMNGTKVFDYTDPNPLPAGGIGLGAVWETQAVFDDLVVQDVGIPFAAFTPAASLKLSPKSQDDSFNVSAKFSLGAENNGIDPVTENVTITFGSFSTTIPAGKFQQQGSGLFTFEGNINKIDLKAQIHMPESSYDMAAKRFKPMGYWFSLEATGTDLDGTVVPPEVKLTIGDDTGQAKLNGGKAQFGQGKDGKHKDDDKQWLSHSYQEIKGHRR
jgi:hypothetical protein